MASAKEIIAEMSKELGISEDKLSYITDDLINSRKSGLVEVADLKKSDPSLTGVWTGNHFVANGSDWSWDDAPGSQCGRARTLHWTRAVGNSYVQSGQCPQGYPWFTINV